MCCQADDRVHPSRCSRRAPEGHQRQRSGLRLHPSRERETCLSRPHGSPWSGRVPSIRRYVGDDFGNGRSVDLADVTRGPHAPRGSTLCWLAEIFVKSGAHRGAPRGARTVTSARTPAWMHAPDGVEDARPRRPTERWDTPLRAQTGQNPQRGREWIRDSPRDHRQRSMESPTGWVTAVRARRTTPTSPSPSLADLVRGLCAWLMATRHRARRSALRAALLASQGCCSTD
jgi:hypothetical protein